MNSSRLSHECSVMIASWLCSLTAITSFFLHSTRKPQHPSTLIPVYSSHSAIHCTIHCTIPAPPHQLAVLYGESWLLPFMSTPPAFSVVITASRCLVLTCSPDQPLTAMESRFNSYKMQMNTCSQPGLLFVPALLWVAPSFFWAFRLLGFLPCFFDHILPSPLLPIALAIRGMSHCFVAVLAGFVPGSLLLCVCHSPCLSNSNSSRSPVWCPFE